MQKQMKNFIVGFIAVVFASCGAKTSNNAAPVTEKKAKLEALKKQQQQLSDQIAALEKEI